jgi:four helix bundle protein
MAFKFEQLIVWQKSIEIADNIHQLTKNYFPGDELHILTSQIKRAADSISLNIAEGSTGQSDAEFSRFLGYSLRSALEVVNCLYLAKRRTFINNEVFDQQYEVINELVKKIQSLRNSLK